MKKNLLLIPALGLILSCAGNADKSSEANEEMQQQIEALEESNEKLEQSLQETRETVDTLQAEIDELLNEI